MPPDPTLEETQAACVLLAEEITILKNVLDHMLPTVRALEASRDAHRLILDGIKPGDFDHLANVIATFDGRIDNVEAAAHRH